MSVNATLSKSDGGSNRFTKFHFYLLIGLQFLTSALESTSGPVLPDLMCILDADLKSVSTIFSSYWLGQSCTSLLGIFVKDKVDVTMAMALSLVLQALATAPLPLITVLQVADVMYLIMGGCSGILKIGSYVQINIFSQKSNFGYHMLSVSSALGFVVTPYVTGLFISPHQISTGNKEHNRTLIRDSCQGFSTNIEYIFILLSLACLSFAIGFVIVFSKSGKDENTIQPNTFEPPERSKRWFQLFIFKTLLLCLFGTLPLVQISVLSLMVTYGMRSDLHLSVSMGTLLTSVFSVCLLLSRVINTIFSNRVPPDRMFSFYMVLSLCIAIYFAVYKTYSTTELLFVCVFMGVGLAPHIPCIMSWSKSYVAFTVQFVSLLFAFSGVETIFGPTISGILMDLYGPDMFVYTMCGILILQFLLFLVVWNLARRSVDN